MGAPRRQPTYGPARLPPAWFRFVAHNPAFFSPDPAIAAASPRLWRALQGALGAFPNANYRPDHGRDTWTVAAPYGDCEDLSLARMAWLVSHGVPIGALRPTVCKLHNGKGHVVLSVITDDGDYILDTFTQTPRLWFEADYLWLKRLKCRYQWERLTA